MGSISGFQAFEVSVLGPLFLFVWLVCFVFQNVRVSSLAGLKLTFLPQSPKCVELCGALKCFFLYWKLGSPGWPGIHYADGLELGEILLLYKCTSPCPISFVC